MNNLFSKSYAEFQNTVNIDLLNKANSIMAKTTVKGLALFTIFSAICVIPINYLIFSNMSNTQSLSIYLTIITCMTMWIIFTTAVTELKYADMDEYILKQSFFKKQQQEVNLLKSKIVESAKKNPIAVLFFFQKLNQELPTDDFSQKSFQKLQIAFEKNDDEAIYSGIRYINRKCFLYNNSLKRLLERKDVINAELQEQFETYQASLEETEKDHSLKNYI